MPSEIYVEVKASDQGGAIKATADITLETDFGEITILRAKIIQKDDNNPWIAYPDISYKDEKTGEYKHIPVLQLSRRLKREIEKRVFEQYAEVSSNATPF